MPEFVCTPTQRRAALEVLGLDPDLTISVSLATDWASATVADTTEDGALRMVDGQLVTKSVSGPIAEPTEPDTTSADQPAA